MKITLIIDLHPDHPSGLGAETVTFEQTNKRRMSETDRDTEGEAQVAAEALGQVAGSALKWLGERMPNGGKS